MKKYLVFGAALLMATPAMAWIKVTNLSGVPQTVIYSVAGSDDIRVISNGQTQQFDGIGGMLALGDPATIAKAKAAKPGPMGSVFGDLVASNRTSGIPTRGGASFVIWPDGRLVIQKYRAMRTMF